MEESIPFDSPRRTKSRIKNNFHLFIEEISSGQPTQFLLLGDTIPADDDIVVCTPVDIQLQYIHWIRRRRSEWNVQHAARQCFFLACLLYIEYFSPFNDFAAVLAGYQVYTSGCMLLGLPALPL